MSKAAATSMLLTLPKVGLATAGLLLVLAPGCGRSSKNSGGTNAGSVTNASANSAAPITAAVKYYNYFPFNNVYTSTVQIGGQTVETVLDTGSSNLLALGDAEHCPGCVNEYGYSSIYTPGAGATDLVEGWSMDFEPIGQARAEGYSDNIGVADLSLNNYNFGLVTSEQGIPNIWGLAYPALADSGSGSTQLPLFDALVVQDGLPNKFSLRLCAEQPGSSLVLGDFDAAAKAQASAVKWTPLVSKLWYTINVARVYTASGSGTGASAVAPWNWSVATGDTLIVDSGTNPLVFPETAVTGLVTLLQSVAAAHKISLPADFWPTAAGPGGHAALTAAQIAAFPPLYLDIEDATAAGKIFTLTIAPTTYFQTRTDGQYFLGLEVGTGPQFILGTVFMENYVVLFNRGSTTGAGTTPDADSQVGFYPVAGLCH